jgi:pyruvate,orthophosphate dikinase
VPSELSLLRTLDIKGRATETDLAAALDADVSARCAEALDAEYLRRSGAALQLTGEGRARLAELRDAESAGLDDDAIAGLYERFRAPDRAVKEIVRDWQIREDVPNDHADPDYDAAVLARLDELHGRAAELLAEWAEHVPRVRAYLTRLDRAMANIAGGDHGYVSSPLRDSYHTVWFELHDDLLGIAGLSREAEEGPPR